MDFIEAFVNRYAGVLGVIGTVVTLGSLIFAVWAWRRPKTGRLYCGVQDNPLGVPDDPDLAVHYKGVERKAPRLITIRLGVSGEPDLKPSNFDQGYLRFSARGVEVLGEVGDTRGAIAIEPLMEGGGRVGTVCSVNPCIIKHSEPAEIALLGIWHEDWMELPNPSSHTRKIGLSFMGFSLGEERQVELGAEPAATYVLEAKLSDFRALTMKELKSRASWMDILLGPSTLTLANGGMRTGLI